MTDTRSDTPKDWNTPNTTHPSSPELRAVEAQGHVTEHDALLSGSAPDYGTVEDDLPELRQTLLEQKQSHDEVVATKPLKSRIRTYAYWAYYIPIARWLPVYSVPLFAGDCAAGLTMACLLVPQAMAYAGLAKLDPVHGLFAVCIPGFIYAILGSSAQLSVGPEAALSLLTGQTISSIMKDVPDHHAHSGGLALALATMITLQVGMITFLLGIFRLGFLDAVLSRPLLRGFITGIGFVIFVEQAPAVLGITQWEKEAGVTSGTTLEKLLFVMEYFWNFHPLTLMLSLVALFSMITFRSMKVRLAGKHSWIKFVPEVLLCVVITTWLTSVFRWDKRGLVILGNISPGHVKIRVPLWRATSYFTATLPNAALIAIMGFIDSIVAAKQNASQYNYSVSPNRELVALGAANIAASFISGTIPGYGSITRSRLNGSAGARTQAAGLFSSTFVILTTYFLLDRLYFLPKSILSTIICLVVYSILKEAPHDIKFFWKMGAWADLSLMLVTFLLTILWNVQAGVVISIALSLILVVQRSASMHIKVMGRLQGTDEWVSFDEDSHEDNEEVPGVLIARIRGDMNFANAGALKERLRRLERFGASPHHPSASPKRADAGLLVLHMGDVDELDASAAQILLEVVRNYQASNVPVYIVHLARQPYDNMVKAGIVDILGGSDHIQSTVKKALDFHFL